MSAPGVLSPDVQSPDVIFIEGLEFVGHHGVFAHERRDGCRFSVDVRLTYPLERASRSDALRETIDYGAVTATIVEVGCGQSVYLIERLAHALADVLLERFPIEQVELTLRKLAPPVRGAPDAVGVRLTRSRAVRQAARQEDRWGRLARRVCEDQGALSRAEALEMLCAPDDELLALLQAAFLVRRRTFGRTVQLLLLQNVKSGACPEDCGFCSQSHQAQPAGGETDRYPMQSLEALLEGARQAHALGAVRYCMVAALRRPTSRGLQVICDAARAIGTELPELQLCASLGLLDHAAARALADAGIDRYNHNLETSRRHFPKVVSTHTWEARRSTLEVARGAGLELCCGGILGMGEALEDRVELAFAARELQVDSLPLNFLDPRPGTALAQTPRPTPMECLKALAMFRLVNPTVDLRVAGGREQALRHLQPLALYPANSIFVQGYLTTAGQGIEADRAMIRDAGFEVVEVITT